MIGEKDEHTFDVLTSHEIGNTGGFTGYCGTQLLASDVQGVEADGVERILVLGRSMHDDGKY